MAVATNSKTQIPDGWRHVRLGDVAELNRLTWDPADGTSILYLDLTAIATPGLLSAPRKITALDAPSRARRRVNSGDILVSTVRPNLRGFARVRQAPENLVASTGFAVVTLRPGVDGSFVYHHVMSPPFAVEMENATTGQAYPAVRPGDVASYELLLPSLPEQRAIADVLDSIDDAIERTEAVIAATGQLRESLLHQLLTRGVPGWHTEWKDVPGLGTIPADWDVVRLGDVGKWLSGGTPSKARPDFWSGSVPWVSPKDMKVRELSSTSDYISEEAAATGSRLVPAGAILVVVRGMILAHSFPVSIACIRCAFNQDIRALVCSTSFDPEYVLAALEWRRSSLLTLPTPSTHGTMRVVSEELNNVTIPMPPIEEQRVIKTIIESLVSHGLNGGQVLERLKTLKDSTADALLTGRVRISP